VSEQLTLPTPDSYYWRCGGRGEVTVRGTVSSEAGEPEPREWQVQCPACRPQPSVRDEWMAAVRFGRSGEHGRC
jgi:hypothetical protein